MKRNLLLFSYALALNTLIELPRSADACPWRLLSDLGNAKASASSSNTPNKDQRPPELSLSIESVLPARSAAELISDRARYQKVSAALLGVPENFYQRGTTDALRDLTGKEVFFLFAALASERAPQLRSIVETALAAKKMAVMNLDAVDQLGRLIQERIAGQEVMDQLANSRIEVKALVFQIKRFFNNFSSWTDEDRQNPQVNMIETAVTILEQLADWKTDWTASAVVDTLWAYATMDAVAETKMLCTIYTSPHGCPIQANHYPCDEPLAPGVSLPILGTRDRPDANCHCKSRIHATSMSNSIARLSKEIHRWDLELERIQLHGFPIPNDPL